MFDRMLTARVSFTTEELPFAVLLHSYGAGGGMSYEVVARYDNWAICDYWCAMFNIGKVDVAQVKEELAIIPT